MARTRQQNEAGVHEVRTPLSLTTSAGQPPYDLACAKLTRFALTFTRRVELTRPPSRKGGLCRARIAGGRRA